MKAKLGVLNCLYPMPTVIIGANVNGKPNYITMAHVGIIDLYSVSLGMAKAHYTNAGIRQNGHSASISRANRSSGKQITAVCFPDGTRTSQPFSLTFTENWKRPP